MNGKKKFSTKTLSLMGMMIGITSLMAFTPLGLIPLPVVSATTVHIPTIIIAIIEGPLVGGIVGAAFGLVTLIKAIIAPVGVLEPYFVNPLVSVLPRALIGIFAGYTYIWFSKAFSNKTLSYVLASIIGSATNTVFVLGILYIIYVKDIAVKIGTAVGPVFLGVAATNGIMELIVSAIVATAIVAAIKKVVYKNIKA